MKIRVQNRDLEFEIRKGETLLSGFWREGIPVLSPCGGKHRCGKCKVKILEGSIRDIDPDVPPGKNIPIPKNLSAMADNSLEYQKEFPPGIVQACRSIPETDIVLDLVQE